MYSYYDVQTTDRPVTYTGPDRVSGILTIFHESAFEQIIDIRDMLIIHTVPIHFISPRYKLVVRMGVSFVVVDYCHHYCTSIYLLQLYLLVRKYANMRGTQFGSVYWFIRVWNVKETGCVQLGGWGEEWPVWITEMRVVQCGLPRAVLCVQMRQTERHSITEPGSAWVWVQSSVSHSLLMEGGCCINWVKFHKWNVKFCKDLEVFQACFPVFQSLCSMNKPASVSKVCLAPFTYHELNICRINLWWHYTVKDRGKNVITYNN